MRIGLDLDGTLLDSRLRHRLALQKSAAELSLPISDEVVDAYFRWKCDGLRGVAALRRLGLCHAEALAHKWIELIETEDLLASDGLYPDTLPALDSMADANQFFLVTARHDESAARRQIARLGLSPRLENCIVVDAAGAGPTKAQAARGFSLDAVVGDTEADLQWADDLGVAFFASSFGFRSTSYWERRNVTSYGSLSEIFTRICESH